MSSHLLSFHIHFCCSFEFAHLNLDFSVRENSGQPFSSLTLMKVVPQRAACAEDQACFRVLGSLIWLLARLQVSPGSSDAD